MPQHQICTLCRQNNLEITLCSQISFLPHVPRTICQYIQIETSLFLHDTFHIQRNTQHHLVTMIWLAH
jgi:hypothetical protein